MLPYGMLGDAVQDPGPVGEATEHRLESCEEAAGSHVQAVVLHAVTSPRASQEAVSCEAKVALGGGGDLGVGEDEGAGGSMIGGSAKPPARQVHMLPDPVEVPTLQSRMQSAMWLPMTPFGQPGLQNRTDATSIVVHYHGDCFADEDDDVSSARKQFTPVHTHSICLIPLQEDNYQDVVRHATSECNALLHLRQVGFSGCTSDR